MSGGIIVKPAFYLLCSLSLSETSDNNSFTFAIVSSGSCDAGPSSTRRWNCRYRTGLSLSAGPGRFTQHCYRATTGQVQACSHQPHALSLETPAPPQHHDQHAIDTVVLSLVHWRGYDTKKPDTATA